jgi:hypothetical protein
MTGPTRKKTTRDERKFSGCERKEKRERASAGPKGGGGSARLLRLIVQQGHVGRVARWDGKVVWV